MTMIKTKALPSALSRDQFEALAQVGTMQIGEKPSACVARNAKHLCGTKYMVPKRDGTYALTEKGGTALFNKNCIAGLRGLADVLSQQAQQPQQPIKQTTPLNLSAEVKHFLLRKAYVVKNPAGALTVTEKGLECLADIAANG